MRNSSGSLLGGCLPVIDALVTETLSYPPFTIYLPKEEDMEQMAILLGEEDDRVGRESTAAMWLHMASEVPKADNTLLVSPVIISVTGTDSVNQHFHTDGFNQKDAQGIINTVQNNS